MSLHDQLLADFGDTLLDPDGPACLAVIAGREMRVVIDRPEQSTVDPRTGLLISRADIYVRTEDLAYRPMSGAEVVIDGTLWWVEQPHPHGPGVYRLSLYRNAA